MPPTPSAPSSGRRTALWLLLGALALLCFVAVAVVGWWATSRGTDHPDEWDPAVAELADFVESEQGVDFDHPVYVDFLDADQYRKLAGSGGEGGEEAGPGDADVAEDELALYRALGLISGSPDLDAANESIWADGTAAFYDPYEDRIVVRGAPVDGALPLELQVVVVHELAHALQHQVVDLDTLYGPEDELVTTETSDSLLAVLEGDATVLEGAFVEQLDPAQYDELAAAEAARFEESEQALTGAEVPDVLSTMFSMPYQFGPSWVDVERNGPDGVGLATMLDAGRPTTAQILGLVTGVDLPPAVEVDTPELPDGAEELYADTWGAFSWMVPFASWVDPVLASEAATVWAGDAVVVYADADDRVCFDATVALRSEGDAETFAEAVAEWVEQLPEESDASSSADGRQVSVRSCDPGAAVEFTPSADAVAALDRLALRNSIMSSGLVEGYSLDAAGCFADGLIETFGVEGLQDEAIVDSAEFDQRRTMWVEECGI